MQVVWVVIAALFCGHPLTASPSREVYLDESFDGTPSSALSLNGAAIAEEPNRGNVLHVTCQEKQDSRARTAHIKLPVEKMRGKIIWLAADVKAANVSAKPQSWNGIKVMLVIRKPSGTDYPHIGIPVGSFDWKTFTCSAAIPADATAATLALGLEQVSGEAWFDNVRVSLRKQIVQAPAADPGRPIYRGHSLPRLRGAMAGTSLNDADIEYFANTWKGNLLRWQIIQSGKELPGDYDAWLDEKLAKLDQALASCEKHRVMVVVDMHSPPGGESVQGAYVGATGGIFRSPDAQATFIRAWQKIATRYKGRSIIWGFDLMNEPVETELSPECDDWQTLALKAARAVHAIDADRTIIVEPGPWGAAAGFSLFQPLDEPNIVYSFHMYEPHQFTHQNVHTKGTAPIPYPGIIDGRQWDKVTLETAMKPAIDFASRYRVHMYVGEFSAIRWAPGDSSANYLADVTDILEEHGWDWTYHAYREWAGWSVEHEGQPNATTRAAQPTKREKVLTNWMAKNRKP